MTPVVLYVINVNNVHLITLRYERIHSIPEAPVDQFNAVGPESAETTVDDIFDLVTLRRTVTITLDFKVDNEAKVFLEEIYKEHGDDDDCILQTLFEENEDPNENEDMSYTDIAEFEESGQSEKVEIPDDIII